MASTCDGGGMNLRGTFHLSKLYLDCVAETGACAIVYRARLRWGPIALGYAGLLRHEPATGTRYTSTAHPGAAPAVRAGQIAWRTPALDLAVEAHPRTRPFSRRLLDGRHGTIDWDCLAPSADVCVHYGPNVALHGLGYAERLNLALPALRLPIERLRWGRFLTSARAIVWIGWWGPEPRTLVFDNGVLQADATIGDDEIRFGGSRLVLNAGTVLRDADMSEVMRPLARPRPLAMIGRLHEVKWLRLGTLHGPEFAKPVEGRVIHELLVFP